MSLHRLQVPQADVLECKLEILSILILGITCTFDYAAPQMEVSTMMYWQMTLVWWMFVERTNYMILASGVEAICIKPVLSYI